MTLSLLVVFLYAVQEEFNLTICLWELLNWEPSSAQHLGSKMIPNVSSFAPSLVELKVVKWMAYAIQSNMFTSSASILSFV